MSTKEDKEIRKARMSLEDARDLGSMIQKYNLEIKMILKKAIEADKKVKKSYQINNVKEGDDVSSRKLKEIFKRIPVKDLERLYNQQKEKLSESDRREYKKLINNKLGRV